MSFRIALLLLLGAGLTSAEEISVPGDYQTIQDAINAAKEGARILVQPGIYEGQVQLRPGVHLISLGNDEGGKKGLIRAEKTILTFSGSPVVSLAEGSSMDGFTVTGADGGFDEALYAKHHAERGENLADSHGAVGFEDSQPAISIVGVSARVTRCIVRDNGQAGIGVAGENNESVISDNVVFRNMGGGIGIANHASPTVTGNHCSENLRGGIGCRNSSPLIKGNHCFQNVRAGIGIREGATPLVEGNNCYGNRRAGIGVRMPGTEPLIRRNRCSGNGMAGIGCRNEASPWIVENECYGNRLAGIGARSNAKPFLFRNQIRDNEAAAIGLDPCDSGEALILENQIEAKSLVAIGIQKGWRVILKGNSLSRKGGLPPLAMVAEGAEAEFRQNNFSGSGVAAIRSQGKIFVSDNVFRCDEPRKGGPPQWAVWALPGSMASVTDDNEISGWKTAEIPAAKVSSRKELVAAMEAAKAGDTILIAPGVYEGGISGAIRGEKGKPIVIAGLDANDPPVFEGGGNAFHFRAPAFLELRNLTIRGQSGNGINIDDGGSVDTPAHDIILSALQIRDIGPKGNHDGIKLSGVRNFRIENCTLETWGDSGSGIDMVGCHRGVIRGCKLLHGEESNGNGIQTKGGSSEILIQLCHFEKAGGRAVNIGGSTGLDYFRPREAEHEASDITLTDCTMRGSDAAFAFVGVDGAGVRHNAIHAPRKWVFRILQENDAPRFVPCREGEFRDNTIDFSGGTIRSLVNIGPNTDPESFRFSRNAWIDSDAPSETRRRITLPTEEKNGIYGASSPFTGPRGTFLP